MALKNCLNGAHSNALDFPFLVLQWQHAKKKLQNCKNLGVLLSKFEINLVLLHNLQQADTKGFPPLGLTYRLASSSLSVY